MLGGGGRNSKWEGDGEEEYGFEEENLSGKQTLQWKKKK